MELELNQGHRTKKSESVSDLEASVNELKLQNHFLNEQIKKVVDGLNEWIKHSNVRFQRMDQGLTRLEQIHNAFVEDTGLKITNMNQKIGDRRTLDAKVQEMVDRHNNVLRSYEVRMNHMQKLLAEKEAQALAAHAALNETKMDIARLKRL